MRSSLLLSSALTLLTSTTTVLAQDNQSPPFNLLILSDDTTVNGTYLGACHEGAAIEGLCITTPSPSTDPNTVEAITFYFNTSSTSVDPSGLLTWNLPIGDTQTLSEPMLLEYSPSSNLALPLFYPDGEGTYVEFDGDDLMNIPTYVDDTVSPPVEDGPTSYYRWYVCTTLYSSYTYQTLTWLVGSGDEVPQNPSCCAVSVKREFDLIA